MQGIKEYNRKIASLINTRKITSSMKMISTVKMQKFAKIANNSSPWWSASKEITNDAFNLIAKELPLFTNGYNEIKKNLIIICSADQGLCGSYNSKLHNTALRLLEKIANQKQEIAIYAIGAKAHQFFRRRGLVIFKARERISSKFDLNMVDFISEDIISSYKSGLFQKIYFVHTKKISSMLFEPEASRLLPIELKTNTAVDKKNGTKEKELPLIDAAPAKIAEAIVKEYVRAFVHNAIIESSLGEHSSRSTAMDAATNSCNRMINYYTQLRNRARQAAITTELTEIITGKEALECG